MNFIFVINSKQLDLPSNEFLGRNFNFTEYEVTHHVTIYKSDIKKDNDTQIGS